MLQILIYRLLLPIYVIIVLPGWLVRTARRGGIGSKLWERAGHYNSELEFERSGAIHVHAVSVGETLLALRIIQAWKERDPHASFVLAVATPTAMEVAQSHAAPWLQAVYQPVDFGWAVGSYLSRFRPARLILVEGEMWPNLMLRCAQLKIPIYLVNARMSPRSRKRYLKAAAWVRPIFSKLDAVGVQHADDVEIWTKLGVEPQRIRVTGSVKFDREGAPVPRFNPEIDQLIDRYSGGLPVVLAASTHPGEEAIIGRAAMAAGCFFVCAPRHFERAGAAAEDLTNEGYQVVLRSSATAEAAVGRIALLIDTTGELREWMAHVDVVVIGKSFGNHRGGQNPAEPIEASKPVIFGQHMENFEPLAGQLVATGGALRCATESDLVAALKAVCHGKNQANTMTAAAQQVVAVHAGAIAATLDLVIECKRTAIEVCQPQT